MIRISIAGVELLIKARAGLEIRERNPDHVDFFSQGKISISGCQVHIMICIDPMPDVNNKSILFDADSVWSIKQDNKYYWIVLHPPLLKQPLWIARFDHDFSKGMVYCGDRFKDTQNDQVILYNPVAYPLDQILLIHYLARIGGMVIHSAGWRINESGWIFAGKSGAGKSTISNLIVKGTGATFLSDDRIAVRKVDHEFIMYGTPWPGEAGYAVNESVPLKGIFFLSKGTQNDIKRLKPSDVIARLLPVVSIPWYDREKVALMMDFCDAMIASIPMYELTFVPDKSAVDMLVKYISD